MSVAFSNHTPSPGGMAHANYSNGNGHSGYNEMQQQVSWESMHDAMSKTEFNPLPATMLHDPGGRYIPNMHSNSPQQLPRSQIPTPPDEMSPRRSPVHPNPFPVEFGYNSQFSHNPYLIQPNHLQPQHLQPHYVQPHHVQPNQIQPHHIQPNQLHNTTWELQPATTPPVDHLVPQPTPTAPPTPPCQEEEITPTTQPAQNKPKRKRGTKETASQKTQQLAGEPSSPAPLKKKTRGRPRSQPPAQDTPAISSVRQTHLEKNRMAAHKCRQRKKEFVQNLESRCREASAMNKQLHVTIHAIREEILGLKNEVLSHAHCGFWAIDQYLAKRTGDLVGSSFGMRKDGSVDGGENEQDQDASTEQIEGSILKTEENSPAVDDSIFELGFDYNMENDDGMEENE